MNSFHDHIVVFVFVMIMLLLGTWLSINAVVSDATRNGNVVPNKINQNNDTPQSLSSWIPEEVNKSVSVPSSYESIAQNKSTNKQPPNGTAVISPEKNRGDNVDDDDSICFNQCEEFLWNPCFKSHSCCTCCTNRILTVHKMGFTLAHSWQMKYFNRKVSIMAAECTASMLREFWDTFLNMQKEPKYANTQKSWTTYFREVLIVRNIYSALVSGYTYHKSGRECWLDEFGNKRVHNARNPGFKWNEYKQELHNSVYFINNMNLTLVGSKRALLKTVNEFRSLCAFLEGTTEREGMAIYMDYAYRELYQGLAAYYQSIPSSKFTKLVHFEDIFDAPYEVFRSVHDWFSGVDSGEVKIRAGRIPSLVNGSDYDMFLRKELGNSRVHTSNGHSANRDKTTRDRLYSLALEYDRTLYNGRFAKINQLFGYEEL